MTSGAPWPETPAGGHLFGLLWLVLWWGARMGRWPGTISKPSGLPSTRLTTGSLVRILGGGVRVDVPQLVGDALAATAAERVSGGKELPGVWGGALRERGWAGDEELAAELDAAMGGRPAGTAPTRGPGGAVGAARSRPRRGRWGASTWKPARYWRASTIEYFVGQESVEAPDFEDPDRWLYEGSHEGYRDMENYVATVDEAG